MEASEAKRLEEEIAELQRTGRMPVKRQPFNFGIKELNRVLYRMGMPKAEKNRTIRLYKERLYQRVDEVSAKMEEKLLPEETKNATDKEGTALHLGRQSRVPKGSQEQVQAGEPITA